MNRQIRQQIANDMQRGDLKTLQLDDTFKFACTGCGMCCFDIDVLLNPMDVYLMMHSKLARNTHKVRWTYDLHDKGLITSFRGSESKFPLCMIEFRKLPLGKPKPGEEPEFGVPFCPFLVPAQEGQMEDYLTGVKDRRGVMALNAKGKRFHCGLHEEGLKPMICRLSPIGRAWKGDMEKGTLDTPQLFWQPIPNCPGVKKDRTQSVRAYFEGAGIDKMTKYSDWWYEELWNHWREDLQDMDPISSKRLGLVLFNLDVVVLGERIMSKDKPSPESLGRMADAITEGKVPSLELDIDGYFELMKQKVLEFLAYWTANRAELKAAAAKIMAKQQKEREGAGVPGQSGS